MAKIPINDLKSLFQTGDTVTESSMVDLIDTLDDLPITPGSAGQILTTDGNTASWEDAPKELPSQTSANNGQFLMTDGTTTSWQAPDSQLTDFYFEAVPVIEGSIESISELTMKVGSGIQVDGTPFYGSVWYISYEATSSAYLWVRITYHNPSKAYNQPVLSDAGEYVGIAVVANSAASQSGDPFDSVVHPDLIWFSGWKNKVTELVPLPTASNANQVLTVDSAGANYGWEDNPLNFSLYYNINSVTNTNSISSTAGYFRVGYGAPLPSNLKVYQVTYNTLGGTFIWSSALSYDSNNKQYAAGIPSITEYYYSIFIVLDSSVTLPSGNPSSYTDSLYWESEPYKLRTITLPTPMNSDTIPVSSGTGSYGKDITWQPLPVIPPEFNIQYSRDSTVMPAIITPIELSVRGGLTVPNASNIPYLVVLSTDGTMTWYPSTSQSDPTNPSAWSWDDWNFAPGDETTVVVSNHGDLSVADADPYSRGNAEYVNWIQDTWQSVHILQDQPVTSDSGFIRQHATLTNPIQIAMGAVTLEIDRVVPGAGTHGSFTVSAMTSAAAGGNYFLTKYPGDGQTFPPSLDSTLSVGTMALIAQQIDINTYGYKFEILLEDLTTRDSEMYTVKIWFTEAGYVYVDWNNGFDFA
jgi:hypothetical protein